MAANSLAEAVGLGTTFLLGQAVVPALADASGAIAILGGAIAAVALGTLLEGVVVGWAQERVLRSRVTRLGPHAWTLATATGAGAAWAMGMIPSTVISLTVADAPGGSVSEPGPLVQYALAIIVGLVTGPVLGLAQWVVLRREVKDAVRWLWANAVAWGVGMPLIFVGMDYVPWEASAMARAAAIYAVCAAVGLVVGAIHGRVLVRLMREVSAGA